MNPVNYELPTKHAAAVVTIFLAAACSTQEPSQNERSPLVPVSTPDPVMPLVACQQLLSGWVNVSFTVTQAGTVEDVQVIASQPQGLFDAAVEESISRWRYDPLDVSRTVRQHIGLDPAQLCGR